MGIGFSKMHEKSVGANTNKSFSLKQCHSRIQSTRTNMSKVIEDKENAFLVLYSKQKVNTVCIHLTAGVFPEPTFLFYR